MNTDKKKYLTVKKKSMNEKKSCEGFFVFVTYSMDMTPPDRKEIIIIIITSTTATTSKYT